MITNLLSIFHFISICSVLLFRFILVFVGNPVYVLLAFIAIVLEIVILLLTCNLDFFAFSLLVVYIGAIVVLFLFFSIFASIQIYPSSKQWWWKYLWLSVIFVILIMVIWYIDLYCLSIVQIDSLNIPTASHIMLHDLYVSPLSYLSPSLYIEYPLAIFSLIMLLLLALIAPIILCSISMHPEHTATVKKQIIRRQVIQNLHNSIQVHSGTDLEDEFKLLDSRNSYSPHIK